MQPYRNDYRITSVAVQSMRGGSPDHTANRILGELKFRPGKDTPEHLLHTNAVPAAERKECYELRVEENSRGSRGRIWFVDVSTGREQLVDEGRVLDRQRLHPKSTQWVIRMEGTRLASWKLYGPILGIDDPRDGEMVVIPGASPTEPPEKKPEMKPEVAKPQQNQGGQEVLIPVSRIRRFADQPRKHFNLKKLRELGESMAQEGKGLPFIPIIVVPITGDPDHDYELVDGERRWRAAQMMGFPTIKAVVKSREEIPDVIVQHGKSLVANLCREGHNHLEIASALLKERAAGKTPKELSRMVGKSGAWVYQYLRLNNLDDRLKALLSPELPQGQCIGFQLAVALAGLPPNRQFEMYSQVIGIKNVRLRLLKARQLAQEMGAELGGRKKKPADELDVIERGIPRISGDVAMLGILNTRVFGSLVRHRSPTAVEELIEKIEASIKGLQDLKGVIGEARKLAYVAGGEAVEEVAELRGLEKI